MKAKQVVRGDNGQPYGVRINCPGCNEIHVLTTVVGERPCWDFNGDFERPTFSPSLLVTSGHYLKGLNGSDPDGCWCNFAERYPDKPPMPAHWGCKVCHSFIRDGRIEFLSDSTHALAGQTVDLPEIEETDDDSDTSIA